MPDPVPDFREAYARSLELYEILCRDRPDVARDFAKVLEMARPDRHSEDFASVNWFGTLYTFGAGQAEAVKALWAARENHTPGIRGRTLLVAAHSDCETLAELFAGHPAWGTMIQAIGRGVYALVPVPPEAIAAPPRPADGEDDPQATDAVDRPADAKPERKSPRRSLEP